MYKNNSRDNSKLKGRSPLQLSWNLIVLKPKIGNTVSAYKNTLNNSKLNISIELTEIVDSNNKSRWNIRGEYISGLLNTDLEPVAIFDEYWFSWKKFHEDSKLIRLWKVRAHNKATAVTLGSIEFWMRVKSFCKITVVQKS